MGDQPEERAEIARREAEPRKQSMHIEGSRSDEAHAMADIGPLG